MWKILEGDEREKIINYIQKQYVVTKKDLEKYIFIKRRNTIYITNKNNIKDILKVINPKSIGIKILYIKNKKIISHKNLQHFLINKINTPIIEINKEELIALIKKDYITKKINIKNNTKILVTHKNIPITLTKYKQQKIIKTK